MGQQQLLLIVLGVIIVGLAIYGGTRMAAGANQENERDILVQQMNILVSEARKFAARPAHLGGGGNDLTTFDPPDLLTTTDRFTINVSAGTNWVLFQAFGSVEGTDGASPVQIVAQYDFSSDFTSGAYSTMETVN